jgi:hypothetical protein
MKSRERENMAENGGGHLPSAQEGHRLVLRGWSTQVGEVQLVVAESARFRGSSPLKDNRLTCQTPV